MSTASAALSINHIQSFWEAMGAVGLAPKDKPIDDGTIHRFKIEGDKSGSKNGWYILHGDNLPAGEFGSWKTDESHKWLAKAEKRLTSDERKALTEHEERVRKQRAEDQAKRHSEAAAKCTELWGKAATTVQSDHPYLLAKKVQAFGLRQLSQSLLVPVLNSGGSLDSLQFIQPDGKKYFKSGGVINGRYHSIGGPTPTLYICEGYATGATIHEATGSGVAIAFNAGNLKTVAEILQTKCPGAELVIAADNDVGNDTNTGVDKAQDAAKALGVAWTYPELNGEKCDFNDLHAALGLEEVSRQLTANLSSQNISKPSSQGADDAEIDRLAQLPNLEYERERDAAAKRLGIKRLPALDAEVKARQKQVKTSGEANELTDGIEPWPYPVDGNLLAHEIRATFNNHCVLPKGADIALTLWAMASYSINAFRIFPKLCLSSPEKRCGKTTTMEVLGALACKTLNASNVTSAVIFRAIDLWQPTLLIDEADTFMGGNDEMRGIINSGHRKSGAFVLRVDGEGAAMQPKQFSTWAPMAIAMIKEPPDTIKDRSVMIVLQRKRSGDSIHRLPLEPSKAWYEIRQKCQRWYEDNSAALIQANPVIPNVGNDRAEDNWTPLITTADQLGNEWPEISRSSMIEIEGVKYDDDETAGVMVLTDIKQAFNEKKASLLSSQQLVDYLVDLEDRPWCEWKHGHPMTKRSLSNLLNPYKIKSKKIRFGHATLHGYKLEQFRDAFSRYLPCTSIPYGTTEQVTTDKGFSVPQGKEGTPSENHYGTLQATAGTGCSVVPQQTWEIGGDEVNKPPPPDVEEFEL